MTTPRRHRSSALVVAVLGIAVSVLAATPPVDAVSRSDETPIEGLDDATTTRPITVGGVGGLTTHVSVTLRNIHHGWAGDMDIMLTGPNGARVVLMSDACGVPDLVNATLTFDDRADATLPFAGPCESGTFLPTDNGAASDGWPAAPTATSLDAFNGINANGVWSLFVRDDFPSDPTTIGRWTLNITAAPASVLLPGGTGTEGTSSPYPRAVTVTGRAGAITDLDVRLPGLHHGHPDDLDLLLVGPGGQSIVLMSDKCGAHPFTGQTVTFDDKAPAPPDDGPCTGPALSPGDAVGSRDAWPAPAPARPYGNNLSVFNGTSPNGTWRLYAVDDADGGAGFLTSPPELSFTLSVPPQLCQGAVVTVDLGTGQVPTHGPDVIRGTPGNDSISALGGDDVVCGLAGDDTIQGGPGDDLVDGGAGSDTASYAATSAPVAVTLGTTAAQNTGTGTGTDQLRMIENLAGGGGNDRLTGNASDNSLAGRNGDDLLLGWAGDDVLVGGSGVDSCNGGDGTDTVTTCDTVSNVP
ncbi:proprotein convertase P-domain-containing protein [Nocardioides stalactiti]|uniref:proprotein convertase P-domain-containing protein n=1 Tax=Nocardioides stalactiti TaxID=2755356 RepID=UPI001602850B|nr:proprotein convertase P-domain-containing protein [Nocardioides stalactiti]